MIKNSAGDTVSILSPTNAEEQVELNAGRFTAAYGFMLPNNVQHKVTQSADCCKCQRSRGEKHLHQPHGGSAAKQGFSVLLKDTRAGRDLSVQLCFVFIVHRAANSRELNSSFTS